MAISYNTGTTAFVNNSASNNGTITIPAGVLAGDVVLVYVFGFALSGSSSGGVTLTSTATAPTGIGTTQFVQSGNPQVCVVGRPFYIVAGASDPGATLTYTFTGITSTQYWFDVGIVAYTGASTSGIPDCQNGASSFSSTGTGAITTPTATTVASGDWQVQFIGQDPAGSPTVVTPGSLTSRQVIATATNSGVLLNIADSNGSVGGSSTVIGGSSWTVTGSTTGNTWQTAFTVGIKPPAGASVSGTVQPRATVPVPRRAPARAVWRGGTGPAFVAVAAPRQEPYLPPRRKPARAVWAGSKPFTGFVSVAAPRQEPYLPPRRRPARAVVEFTPVTTTNTPPGQSAAPPKAPTSLPRRTLARAVWRGGAGPAFVAVPAPVQGPPRPRSPAPRRAVWRAGPVPGITRPAPRQPPQTVYRHGPARAYVRFTPVVTVNAVGIAVAAPRQLITIPRRTPARAYVRFTPVTTTNPLFVPVGVVAGSPDDKTLVKRRIVWRMLSL